MTSRSAGEQIPVGTALVALFVSALLRTVWFPIALIMPRTATGTVLFYLVLGSAGIVLLHWCLGWFGWTISLRAAFAARALPALAAATVAGVLGFHASLPAVIGLLGVEFLLGAFIVRAAAIRLEGWSDLGTGFDAGEILPVSGGDAEFDAEDRYTADIADLVRSARAARTA